MNGPSSNKTELVINNTELFAREGEKTSGGRNAEKGYIIIAHSGEMKLC